MGGTSIPFRFDTAQGLVPHRTACSSRRYNTQKLRTLLSRLRRSLSESNDKPSRRIILRLVYPPLDSTWRRSFTWVLLTFSNRARKAMLQTLGSPCGHAQNPRTPLHRTDGPPQSSHNGTLRSIKAVTAEAAPPAPFLEAPTPGLEREPTPS